jgi:hypothetical protein
MKPIKFIKRLIGGLNLNANYNDVPPVDFVDGYDIVDRNPSNASDDGYLQPCSNTKLAYDLGEVEATKKKYRVSMDLAGIESCNIVFNFRVLGIINQTISVPYTSGDNAATLFSSIQFSLSSFGYTETLVTASGFVLVFDINYTSVNYTDFFLTVTNSLGYVFSTEVFLDAISIDKVGKLYPSCFCNINNDQQIFATSNVKKPETYSATIVVAGALFLAFVTDVNIESGEEVYFYSQIGGANQISGICTLQPTSIPNQYLVVGTSFISFSPTGLYTVVRYYRSLSVIGYAKKNNINNVWTYTELLRSNKMNFRLYKQIQGALDVTSDGLLYDFTDFLNQIKRLIYKGDIITWGFLTVYNPDAIYDLDTIGGIGGKSNLQLGVNTSKVTLAIATTTGIGGKIGYTEGVKKESSYTAFVRFRTSDGAYTTYSKASNVLWLHSSDVKDHNYGINSGRAIQIKIEQIPVDLFEAVQVGIIEFTSASWVGYSLPEIQINGQETIYVADSGFNSDRNTSFNAAADLLEQIPFVFENAKSILGYINYRLAANVNLYKEYDLTDWAQTITLTAVLRKIFIGDFDYYKQVINVSGTILGGINNYDKCSNDWMSYMPYDHYRFCVFVDWENGSPTSTYWIDDVSFDIADTGFVNDYPFSRTGTAGIDLNMNQLYIEAKDIDMNYILPDGKILKDVVKDIRFGRALCNRQVYATGIAQMVGTASAGGGVDYVSAFSDGGNDVVRTKLALYCPDFQNTSSSFNWEDGDVLKASTTYESHTQIISTDNIAKSFFDYTTPVTVNIKKLINASNTSTNDIAVFNYDATINEYSGGNIYIRNGAAIEHDGDIGTIVFLDASIENFYYIKPYTFEGAYPSSPTQTRFFVIPQDKWYNEAAHDSDTVYKIYGGDAFPTISSYKLAENATDRLTKNVAILFSSYNRTNTGLRSGRFPFYTITDYLENPYLVDPIYEGDKYTYDSVFTPRYIFQNQVAFNQNLRQLTNQFSSLYYSSQGFGSDLAGGNRLWSPLDMKTLESKYGAITHFDILLGQMGTNILIVWQERRVTAQYFDNTANIKSNTGELLIGNGAILEREGQNFSEFGCEHKWTIVKGQTDTGKDVAYWICFRKAAIMRFGSDGTSNIVTSISSLIQNKTILALNNGYNNEDEPALFNGCHAVWDNKRMEYIVTLRLYPKCIPWEDKALKGQYKADPTLTWGFEQFPVIYKSLINNNLTTPPNGNWETIIGYDSEYFEIVTIVWNEKDNKFKTFRSHSPKLYGQFNNNIVSSHPVEGNLIYEHNTPLNEALYYEVETTTAVLATTNPALYRIEGTGIQATFPSPFSVAERSKYIVKIEGKNYEVVGTGTNYLQMASVDNDDILPQIIITDFSYYLCNSQDPYIEGLCNNPEGRYFHFGHKSVQADDILKRTEYKSGYDSLGTPTTSSFTNKSEEEFYNGRSEVQIKQDATNTPNDNEVGLNNVEGIWMKFKSIWRWGKQNRVLDTSVDALESQKTK